jgi:hypothetical protein
MGAENGALSSFTSQSVAIGLLCLITQRAVRTTRVIVLPPCFNRPTGICKAESKRSRGRSEKFLPADAHVT